MRSPWYFPVDATVFIGEGQDFSFGDLPLKPIVPVGSIKGQVLDARTLRPLVGDQEPFGFVTLQRLDASGTLYELVASAPLDVNGQFAFFAGSNGPLIPGEYLVTASANQYQALNDSIFVPGVAAREHRVVPPIMLLSNPVRINNVRPCTDLPATGGRCSFSFNLTNGTDRAMLGATWAIVSGTDSGGFANSTVFEACRVGVSLPSANGNLPPVRTVHCDFAVPPRVPDFALFCATARFGEPPRNPYFTVQGVADLFCIQKQPNANITVLPPGRTAEILRQRAGVGLRTNVAK